LSLVLVLSLTLIRQRADIGIKIPTVVEASSAQYASRKTELAKIAGADPEIGRCSRL
jgi:hypothetical protein